MTDDTHTIRSGRLSATIKAQGAELCSLRHESGYAAGQALSFERPRGRIACEDA